MDGCFRNCRTYIASKAKNIDVQIIYPGQIFPYFSLPPNANYFFYVPQLYKHLRVHSSFNNRGMVHTIQSNYEKQVEIMAQ